MLYSATLRYLITLCFYWQITARVTLSYSGHCQLLIITIALLIFCKHIINTMQVKIVFTLSIHSVILYQLSGILTLAMEVGIKVANIAAVFASVGCDLCRNVPRQVQRVSLTRNIIAFVVYQLFYLSREPVGSNVLSSMIFSQHDKSSSI